MDSNAGSLAPSHSFFAIGSKCCNISQLTGFHTFSHIADMVICMLKDYHAFSKYSPDNRWSNILLFGEAMAKSMKPTVDIIEDSTVGNRCMDQHQQNQKQCLLDQQK